MAAARDSFPELSAAVHGDAWEIRGPTSGHPAVEAWTDRYIPFDRPSEEQQALRSEIRARVRALVAGEDDVLVATFLGRKRQGADIENLTLYNIDPGGGAFAAAGRFGLRFEHDDQMPTAPSGDAYLYGYRYELAPRSGSFTHWREGRPLASCGWVDLGTFPTAKRLEQVWHALKTSEIEISALARDPDEPFVLRIKLQPPRHVGKVALAGVIKPIFDGVTCAWQAHTDALSAPQLAARVARHIPVSPSEIEAHLLNRDRAVLGAVPQLLHARGDGVIWAPSDDTCVAGELLREPATGSAWRLSAAAALAEPADALTAAAAPAADTRCEPAPTLLQFKIRSGTRADLGAVLALWSLAGSTHAKTADRPGDIERLLRREPGTVIVAEQDGRLVGSLIAAFDGWRGNMYRLAVHPDHRRRGIATALIRTGERRLRRKGARRITALVSREDVQARAFWTAVGYPLDEAIGRHVRSL